MVLSGSPKHVVFTVVDSATSFGRAYLICAYPYSDPLARENVLPKAATTMQSIAPVIRPHWVFGP
jgi:hypothetical protein